MEEPSLFNCIFCHADIYHKGNIGKYSADFYCSDCNSLFLYDLKDQEIDCIMLLANKDGTVYIRPSLNIIEIEQFNLEIPLMWLFPWTVKDLLNRIEQLKSFL